MDEHGQQRLLGVEKEPKTHVQHKIDGFFDQRTRKNVPHHILILPQEMTTKVPLDVWLIITFLTFECTKTSEDN